MIEDERIDTEKAIVDAGIDDATERFCDILHTCATKLLATQRQLKSDYTYIERFSHGRLIDLGSSSAYSIITCLLDDMPIDFRRVLTATLDEEESVANEDDIIDRIKQGTVDRISGVIDAGT